MRPLPLILLLTSSALAAAPATRPAPVPQPLATDLRLSPFYRQYVDAAGVPVLGSEKVSPHALLEAASLVSHMLEGRPDLARAIAQNKVRVGVMAFNEFTTDLPEHSDLAPKQHWNLRARGLGATAARPCISCAEENLLQLPGDPYRGESILIHEFGHTIHQMGLNSIDPTFDRRLRKLYQDAIDKGLWKNTYAGSNYAEYFAEGVQDWFDANQSPNFCHNDINTRDKLKKYDPPLAKLLEEVFADRPWRWIPPTQRKPDALEHLSDLDRNSLPKFTWPQALLDWQKAQKEKRAK